MFSTLPRVYANQIHPRIYANCIGPTTLDPEQRAKALGTTRFAAAATLYFPLIY